MISFACRLPAGVPGSSARTAAAQTTEHTASTANVPDMKKQSLEFVADSLKAMRQAIELAGGKPAAF